MMERIVRRVVEAYEGYDGLDELKRGFDLAIAVATSISGIEFTYEERIKMFDEILYRLSKEARK